MGPLAYNIKIIRGISGLNQTSFAQMMKVSLSMQKSYEGERANPDALYIQRLARMVRVKEDDLQRRRLQEKEIVHVEFDQNEQEIQTDIPAQFSDFQERLIRAEAHLEVYESAIAGLLSKSTTEFTKKVGELRKAVQEAANRRFDELHRKSA